MKTTPDSQAEARRAELIGILSSLGDTNLLRLYNAAQGVLQGDKAAVTRLGNQVREESAALEEMLLNGRTPEQFQEAVINDVNNQGGES